MSSFYYFIPNGKPGIRRDDVVSRGLGYTFDERLTARGCDGPSGSRGAVVCPTNNADGQLGYFPGSQTWRQIPGSDVWCGMYTDSRPTPDDLARSQAIAGQWVRLDDGHMWLLPMARRWVEIDDRLLWDYNLPRRLTYDDAGQWVPGSVKPRYEQLWNMAIAYEQTAAEAMANATEDIVRFEFPAVDELAIGALQINYRVSAIECDMLGIYDDAARNRIISTLLDDDTRNAWLKKKLPE